MARNPATHEDTLNQLAEDSSVNVRIYLAMNEKSPSPTLSLLSDDPEIGVRRRVAENPKTPEETLRHLLRDKSTMISSIARKRLVGEPKA